MKPLALCALVSLFAGCLPDPCANARIAEELSPDKNLKVVTFRRDCGATTNYSVQVLVSRAGKPLPNEAGNVFVASGEPLVVARWTGDRRLSISGGAAQGACKAESSYGDVLITYH